MSFLNNSALWTTLSSAVINIPFFETAVLLLILTICLLLRWCKLGLLVAYIAVYRWGWIFLESGGLQKTSNDQTFLTIYIVIGIIVFTLTAAEMLIDKFYFKR
jgi:hypothetical protein